MRSWARRAVAAALAGGVVLAGARAASASLSDGLVGHWPLDETAGLVARDCSGNGNDGDLLGGMAGTEWTAGQLENGLALDGAGDCVDCGDIDAVDGAAELTVAAWIQINDTGRDHTIVAKSNWGVPASSFFMWRDDVCSVSGRIDTVSVIVGSARYEGADGALGDTGWHHVAFTFTAEVADGIQLYIDGAEDTAAMIDTTGLTGVPSSTMPVRIGLTADNSGPLGGVVDDVRIYNRALGQAEIQDLFNLTSDVIAPGDPTALGATAAGANQMDLTWTGVGDADLYHYAIYRDTASISSIVGMTPVGVSGGATYSDTGLMGDTTY